MAFIHGAFKRELLNAVSLKNLFSSSVACWKLHFPSLGQVWTQLHRGLEESLADRFSCKALPQLQLPQVAFFRILSCWCARPFPPKCSLISSGLLCPEMKGSLFGFQRSGASRRTCEFSLWRGKVFPHPGIYSFKIRKMERKVFNPICLSLF